MWEVFRKYGRVVDIRDKFGNKFGFVQFVQVNNSQELLMELKAIWVGSFKLKVETARGISWQRKLRKSLTGEEQGKLVTKDSDRGLWLGRNLASEQRKTYADAVRQEHRTRMQLTQPTLGHKVLEFIVEQTKMEWLKGAYVGCLHDVKAHGGDLILLSSPNVGSLQSIVTEDAKRLAKWLADIRPWKHTRDISFFAKVASSWGTFIPVDDCTRKKKSFDMAHVLIITLEIRPINKIIQIKVNEHIFHIRVAEEMARGYGWSTGGKQHNLVRIEEALEDTIIKGSETFSKP
ncbi:hypothetical protein Ancab_007016 [Ancistrocladus abbreviatus]